MNFGNVVFLVAKKTVSLHSVRHSFSTVFRHLAVKFVKFTSVSYKSGEHLPSRFVARKYPPHSPPFR